MLTVVSVDSSSRRRQLCVAASLCFGRVPGYSPARATDASPAQLARAPTQTPVSKIKLGVKLVNIVLLVKLLIHVFWYVRKNSSSTFKTLSHSMTMTPLKHETFTGARMDERFFYLRRFPSRFIFKLDQFVLQFTDGSKIWNSILVG